MTLTSIKPLQKSGPDFSPNEKTRYDYGRAISSSILFYKLKNQRNNSEIPRSTTEKYKAKKITVTITTTVYFVSSLLFGQLVFRISAPTSCRKVVTLLILA